MPHQLVRGDGRQRPAQMPVTGVVEHIGLATRPHARQHVGHHRPQTCPGLDPAGIDAGEALVNPVHQGADALGADVAVDAVELGRAGNAEAVLPQAAGDQLGFVVQQTDHRRGLLAGGVF